VLLHSESGRWPALSSWTNSVDVAFYRACSFSIMLHPAAIP
jgi:hypothetical protein